MKTEPKQPEHKVNLYQKNKCLKHTNYNILTFSLMSSLDPSKAKTTVENRSYSLDCISVQNQLICAVMLDLEGSAYTPYEHRHFIKIIFAAQLHSSKSAQFFFFFMAMYECLHCVG